jgi:hypothetical protein
MKTATAFTVRPSATPLSILMVLALGLGHASPASAAANFVLNNVDGPGEGFNDPAAPPHANQKGNNPGNTLGQMRLNVLQAVASQWGATLNSSITITVNIQFDPLTCAAQSAQLGSASATATASGFAGSQASTAYHIALAESISGGEINHPNAEMTATFNSALDTNNPACLGGGGFYYGLDGNAPAGTTDLFPVVLHEFAHALGFTPIYNPATGAFTSGGGFPDVYSRNLLDVETGKSWPQMNNAERLASSTNEPDLMWSGNAVNARLELFLDPVAEVKINAPPGIVGTHTAVLGEEPLAVIPLGGVTASMMDATALLADPCVQVPPGQVGAFTGKIALYDLPGGCPGFVPAFYADIAGAAGVIIRNTSASGLPDVSGLISNQDITIPYVGVTQAVGNSLRTNIGTANVTLQNSATLLNGVGNSQIRMYAPTALAAGSSVAHWTRSARPDLLMEPVKGILPYNQIDLTRAAMVDIGWSVNGLEPEPEPEVIFENGFENPLP